MKDKSRTIKIIGLIVALMAGLGISSLLMRHSSSKENAAAAGKWFCLSENLPSGPISGEEEALQAISEILKSQGIADVSLVPARTDLADGDTFYRFSQQYEDYPVLGRSAVLAVDSTGTPITATGNITALTGSIPDRLLDQERAAQKAANQAVQNDDIEDMVKSVPTELVWVPTDTGEAELCWHVSVTSTENSLVNRSHFLSAKNGKILVDLNLNDYFSEPVSMESEHGPVEITAEKVSEEAGGTYRLYDDSRGIQVLELEAVTQFPSEERRKEISVQSPEEDALLTMKNLELTSDFYQNILGRNSWDGKGSRISALLLPFSSDQASSNGGEYLAFTPGGETYSSGTGTALDLVAHEFAHSVMFAQGTFAENATASLFADTAYGNAISEGYADVLGNLTEAYYDPDSLENWDLGEDAGHSKYSMKDPTASLIPDSKKKHYTASALDFDEEADDGYRNAGILSYGAYLMWKGTSGGGYTAEETGITDISVLSRLWYRSLLYLHSDAHFSQVADALTCAAKDLLRQGALTPAQYEGVQMVLGDSGISLRTQK